MESYVERGEEAHKIEASAISVDLNANKNEYARQLKEILVPSQIRTPMFQNAMAINKLSILEIGAVYPDFPPCACRAHCRYSYCRSGAGQVLVTIVDQPTQCAPVVYAVALELALMS